jgi:hypothetical protein
MSKFENKTQPTTNTNEVALTMTVHLHRQQPEPRNPKCAMLIDLRFICYKANTKKVNVSVFI